MDVVEAARARRGTCRLHRDRGRARSLGYRVVRLDTEAHQPHVRRLFESAGYEEIADYDGNPFACYSGEKRP